MVAKTPAAGKAAPATKPKKALVASSPVEPGEQLPEGASASDAGVPGTPGTSSAGDASGMVAPQGETSPDLGAGDGEMHHSKRDKAEAAGPTTPPEPTWEFRASSAIEHDGSRIEPGAPLTLTREQFEALKAVGAVDGAWPEVSS